MNGPLVVPKLSWVRAVGGGLLDFSSCVSTIRGHGLHQRVQRDQRFTVPAVVPTWQIWTDTEPERGSVTFAIARATVAELLGANRAGRPQIEAPLGSRWVLLHPESQQLEN